MCAYLFSRKNRTCAVLLGTVRLIILDHLSGTCLFVAVFDMFDSQYSHNLYLCDLLLEHIRYRVIFQLRTLSHTILISVNMQFLYTPCVLIWACAFN